MSSPTDPRQLNDADLFEALMKGLDGRSIPPHQMSALHDEWVHRMGRQLCSPPQSSAS